MSTYSGLTLQATQKLVINAQLKQALQRLQCPLTELEAEVLRALAENPLLERIDPADTGHIDGAQLGSAPGLISAAAGQEALPLADTPDTDGLFAALPPGTQSEDGKAAGLADGGLDWPDVAAPADTLQEHLRKQLSFLRLSDREQVLVWLLLDELDDNGYLPQSLEQQVRSIVQALPELAGVCHAEWEQALSVLQSLEPTGVGARSLAECLHLQVPHQAAPDEVKACATWLVALHLPALGVRKQAGLQKQSGYSPQVFDAAVQLVGRLDPKPGRPFSVAVAMPVLPELLVQKTAAGWQAFLNPRVVPRLRVRQPGLTAVGGQIQADTKPGPVQDRACLAEARSLVRHIEGRYSTLLLVGRLIVGHQQAVFDGGPSAMRALNLQQIADAVHLHVSTVSRTVRYKYIQTPQGVFPLRHFLSGAVPTRNGQGVSSAAVRAYIREWLASEPADQPWSDQKLSVELAARGIRVARRTVAKYREQEGIPAAWQRKARASGNKGPWRP